MNDTNQFEMGGLEEVSGNFFGLSEEQSAQVKQYIQTSRRKFLDNIDQFFDGRLIYKPQDKSFIANARLLNWLHYDKQHFPSVKALMKAIVYQEDYQKFQETIEHVATTASSQDIVIRFVTKQQEIHWAILRVRKLSHLVVAMVVDITSQKRIETALKTVALYDDLTKLPNRTSFYESLKRAIARAERRNQQIALFYIDVDNFKKINDTLGHDYGDKTLKHVAKVLKRSVRDEDLVARIGGDEFTIISEDVTTPMQAAQIAKRIIEGLKNPAYFDDKEVQCTVSIGIAIFPSAGKSIGELMRHADLAMYGAKTNGRNDFRFYSEARNKEVVRKSRIDTELRKALETEELFFEFQPIVNAKRKKHIVGFEAFIRWNNEALGMVTPYEIIPTAEETGFMRELGLWIIESVLRKFSSFLKQFPEKLKEATVSVNLSHVHLYHEDFPLLLQQALSKYCIEASRLILEISEVTMVGVLSRDVEVLHRLKELGVILAVDNFGIGNLSLVSVARTPVKLIKIDRSFIQEVSSNAKQKELLKSILKMSKNLEIQVAAEGVETKKQKRLLSKLGFHAVQGYFISRPLSESDFISFIESYGSARRPSIFAKASIDKK